MLLTSVNVNIWRLARLVGISLLLAVVVLAIRPGRAFGTTPTVTLTGTSSVTGSPALTTFTDQQVIGVTVSANSTFTHGTGINILECADPGGTEANLPTSDATCDGNTIDGDNIIVAADGSFEEVAGGDGGNLSGYTIYALPSAVLAEQPDGQPVCNATNACVLYIGANQNDFTQPKVFSEPFYVGGGTPPTTTTTTTSSSTTTTSTTRGSTTTTSTTSGTTTTTSTTNGSTTTTTGSPDSTTTTTGAGVGLAGSSGSDGSGSSDGSGGSGGSGTSGGSDSSGAGSSSATGATLAFTGSPGLLWLLLGGLFLVIGGTLGKRWSTVPTR